jgi:pimeloyl-ACP methyl ester carboxylesterase
MLAAPATPHAQHTMTRFDPRAIVIATLLSLALDVVGGALLMAGFSTGLIDGMSPEQLTTALQAVLKDTGFMLASLCLGTATTVFGGYIAARLARAYPYFNALAVGLVGIALGLLLSSDSPWWFDALAYLITLPAAVLGAHLARRSRN